MQGLFKHIKGPGEPECTDEDFDDTFDLENPAIRRTEEGQQAFELAHSVIDCLTIGSSRRRRISKSCKCDRFMVLLLLVLAYSVPSD